jgi:hypothetical protein
MNQAANASSSPNDFNTLHKAGKDKNSDDYFKAEKFSIDESSLNIDLNID